MRLIIFLISSLFLVNCKNADKKLPVLKIEPSQKEIDIDENLKIKYVRDILF